VLNNLLARRYPAGLGASAMLDIIYIATGAAFLMVCALYAFACDRL